MSSKFSDEENDVASSEPLYGVDRDSTSNYSDYFDFDSFRQSKDSMAEHKLEKRLEEFTDAIERRQMSEFNPRWKTDVEELIKNNVQDERERLIVLLLKKICSFRDPSNRLFIICCYWFLKNKILTSEESFTASSEPKLPRVISNRDKKDGFILQCLDVSTYKRDYVEEEPLGSGGFGAVFKARHKVDGRHYAVKKIIFRCRQFVPRFADTLLREVQVLSRVTSGNIARYYGAFIEQCSEEEATRYCQEQNLSQVTWTASETSGCPSSTVNTTFNKYFNKISGSEVQKKTSAIHPVPLQTQFSQRLINIFPESGKYNHLQLFLLMEFCGYHTLKDYITVQDRIPNLEEIMSILVQCLYALESLHLLQIVHRDVKPSNIFLKPPENLKLKDPEPYFEGTLHMHQESKRIKQIASGKPELPLISNCVVKLGDFGLSKFCDSYAKGDFDNHIQSPIVIDECNTSKQSPSLTANVGTRFYSAPEIRDASDYDVKVDIYSLGIVFFELLSPPFRTMHERAIALSNLRKKGVPREILEKFGKDIASMLEQMVDTNPETRSSVKELIQMVHLHKSGQNSRHLLSAGQYAGADLQEDEARKQYGLLSKSELINLIIMRDTTLAEQRRKFAINGSAEARSEKSTSHHSVGP